MVYGTAIHFCVLTTCNCLLVPGVFRDPSLLKKERPSLSEWPMPEVWVTLQGRRKSRHRSQAEVFSVGQELLREAAQEGGCLIGSWGSDLEGLQKAACQREGKKTFNYIYLFKN